MIKISKDKWNSISKDYKSTWKDYNNEKPEWVGRKTVLAGCVDAKEGTKLLVEGVHFIIE